MDEAMDGEIQAMAAVARALDSVKDDAAVLKRVMRWTMERYGVAGTEGLKPLRDARRSPSREETATGDEEQERGQKYESVAELFDAAHPKTDWAKAVVVGHWFMTGEGKVDFTGQEVNDSLKNLGHGVSNITDALNKAMRQKPALVIQTEKSGKAKQARKKYKVTRAGVLAVEGMTAAEDSSDE